MCWCYSFIQGAKCNTCKYSKQHSIKKRIFIKQNILHSPERHFDMICVFNRNVKTQYEEYIYHKKRGKH